MQRQNFVADQHDTAAKKQYVPVTGQHGRGFYALFTTYSDLKVFESARYKVTLKNGHTISTTVRPHDSYIVVREKETKTGHTEKRYDLVMTAKILGQGHASYVCPVATFKMDDTHPQVMVKFTRAVKQTIYKMADKTIHQANLEHEHSFTKRGAPALKMEEPLLLDDADEKGGLGLLFMKRLEGLDLAKLIVNQYYSDSFEASPYAKLTIHDLLTILLRIGAALEDLHENKKLVHRDFNPKNIFIKNDLSIQLIDFAFTKNSGENDNRLCGTPEYLDPYVIEQLGGVKNSKDPEKKTNLLTEKCEVFVFGLIIMRLLNIKREPIQKSSHENFLEKIREFNSNIVINPSTIQLPDLTREEIKRLVELVKPLFNFDPNQRPTMQELMPLLKELINPILQRLAEEPDHTCGQLIIAPKTVEAKLGKLRSFLLFKPFEPSKNIPQPPLQTNHGVDISSETSSEFSSAEDMSSSSSAYSNDSDMSSDEGSGKFMSRSMNSF